MKRPLFTLLPLIVLTALTTVAASGQKSSAKPPTKPQGRTSDIGVKGVNQMAGGAIRFGELIGLKTGYTYQILSARYSIDYFADFIDATHTDEKFLILTVAIKNNRKADNWFNTDAYAFQAVDSMNQNYEGSAYILSSKPGEPLSPTLKPGQGLGQNASDPVIAAIRMPANARLVKLILKNGREGSSEEVLRFFLADATEAEAGGKPDPKNTIAPLPRWAEKGAVIPQGQYVPSGSFYFKLNGFSTAAKLGDAEPEEGKMWVFANLTVKNARRVPQGIFSFFLGDFVNQMVLIDADGEKYPASQFLKASRVEQPDGNMESLEERVFRVAFQTPKGITLKTARLGSPNSHLFVFDASMAGK